MADAPPDPPAAFQPSIAIAPLAVLAIGALVTHFASEAAAANSHGGWINLSSLTYALGWMVYVVCATGFVWMDYLFVQRLPGRTWPSSGRMLLATVLAAAAGSGAAALASLMVGGVLIAFRDLGGQAAFLLPLALVPLAGVVGLVADLRIRRSARIRLKGVSPSGASGP